MVKMLTVEGVASEMWHHGWSLMMVTTVVVGRQPRSLCLQIDLKYKRRKLSMKQNPVKPTSTIAIFDKMFFKPAMLLVALVVGLSGLHVVARPQAGAGPPPDHCRCCSK